MIKLLLIEAAFLLYIICSCTILIFTIVLPFPIVHEELPTWAIVLISVCAFIIAVTQRAVIEFFKAKEIIK